MENGPRTVIKREHHEAHYGRENAGDDGLELEISLAVKDLCGKKRGPEGRFEDGPDSARRSGEEHDTPLGVAQLQIGHEDGSEPGADLGDGALFPCRRFTMRVVRSRFGFFLWKLSIMASVP